jgi:hypothetical protein
MEIITGKIVDVQPGFVTIRASYDNIDRLLLRQYSEVQVGLEDGRKVTPEQRRKAFALVGEIAAWSGYERDEAHLTLKHDFIANHLDQLQKELFSMSDCDVTTAKEYITYLIDFCLTFDVPTHVPLVDLCDDIERYVYSCLIHKKCAVCGKKAELHHVDRVGMGNNRNEIQHEGRRCLPLCQEHHMEVDQIGDEALCRRYHLSPVLIDARVIKTYRLRTKKEQGNGS